MKCRRKGLGLALSSLAFATTTALWARSYVQVEYVWHASPSGGVCFVSENGSLHFLRGTESRTGPPRWGVTRFHDRTFDLWPTAFRRFESRPLPGFAYDPGPGRGASGLGIPYLALMLLAGVWPARRLARHDRPKWLCYAAACAVGFWPFGSLLLEAPDFDAADVGGLVVSWFLSAVIAACILPARAGIGRAALERKLPWQWKRRRAEDRSRRGLCARCGYDLRAEPGRGGELFARCPECGSPARPAGRGAGRLLPVAGGSSE